jgi:hypothetical protein
MKTLTMAGVVLIVISLAALAYQVARKWSGSLRFCNSR